MINATEKKEKRKKKKLREKCVGHGRRNDCVSEAYRKKKRGGAC